MIAYIKVVCFIDRFKTSCLNCSPASPIPTPASPARLKWFLFKHKRGYLTSLFKLNRSGYTSSIVSFRSANLPAHSKHISEREGHRTSLLDSPELGWTVSSSINSLLMTRSPNWTPLRLRRRRNKPRNASTCSRYRSDEVEVPGIEL